MELQNSKTLFFGGSLVQKENPIAFSLKSISYDLHYYAPIEYSFTGVVLVIWNMASNWKQKVHYFFIWIKNIFIFKKQRIQAQLEELEQCFKMKLHTTLSTQVSW